MPDLKTDILIIGGGIAGCIAAISLVEFYQVTLIDKLVVSKEKIGESLAPAANRILKELDLLDELEREIGSLYKKNMGMQSYWGVPAPCPPVPQAHPGAARPLRPKRLITPMFQHSNTLFAFIP